MNELAYGQKINTPISIKRSVSFEKIRQGSLSTGIAKKIENSKVTTKNYQQPELYEQLITQKLLGNQKQIPKNNIENKQTQILQNNKTAVIKKELQQKQMKQCTFKPKVNKNNNPQRTLQQFIDQQVVYEKQKQDKVNQMREIIRTKMDKENTFQPSLMNNANNQCSRRPAGPAYQRLYEQKTRRCEFNEQPTPPKSLQKNNNQNKSKPKIITYSRKNSDKSIVQSYIASKKCTPLRNETQQFHISVPEISQCSKQSHQNKQDYQCQSKKQHSCTHSSRSNSHRGLKITKYMDVQELCQRKLVGKKVIDERQTKKVSTKNKQIYINKVLREISSILSEMNINQLDLSYIQMSQILEKMNFIDQTTNINDRKYLFEIWQMLQGDLYESCPLANLIKIIFCLLGCHDSDIVNEYLVLTLVEGTNKKKLVLTQKQSKNIKSSFQQLALNRLKKGEYVTNEPKFQSYTFKPFVSKNSVQMAQKYRQKIIQQSEKLMNNNLIKFDVGESGQVDHVDLLLLDDKCKELKMKLKREEQEKEKKRLEDEAMIGQKYKKSKPKLSQTSESTNLRFQHLYELGKQNIRNKNEKFHDMVQMSKQCTFQPNIGRNKENLNNRLIVKQNKQNSLYSTNPHELLTKATVQIKDFDKTIFRMYEGRRIREQAQNNPTKQATDRSISDQQCSRDENTPLLYLNINMTGYEDVKVPVFHRDNMKTITHKVKIMVGLEYAEDSKLQEILRLQIIPTLKQIGMDLDLE